MGVKRKKKREIKKKAVLSKMLERTAQNRVIFVTITKKEKSSKPAWLLDFCGGDGGIRTHVPFRTTRFRVIQLYWSVLEFTRMQRKLQQVKTPDFSGIATVFRRHCWTIGM